MVALTKADLADAARRDRGHGGDRRHAVRYRACESGHRPGVDRERGGDRRAARSAVRRPRRSIGAHAGAVASALPSTARSRLLAQARSSPERSCPARSRSAIGSWSVPAGLSARVRSIHAQNRADRARPRGRALRAQSRRRGDQPNAIARGDVVLDPELHAPTGPHRCHAARACRRDAGRSRIGYRFGCTTPPPRSARAWLCWRRRRSRPARKGACSSCSTRRSRLRSGTASSCATPRHSARSAAGDFSICAGRRAGAAPRSAKRNSTPTRWRHAQHALAALLAARRITSIFVLRARPCARRGRNGEDRCRPESRCAARRRHPARISEATARDLKATIASRSDAFHREHADAPGLDIEQLRRTCAPRFPAPLFRALLQLFAETRALSLEGATVRLPTHSVQLRPQDEKLFARIMPLLSGAERFRPPRVRDIATTLAIPEQQVRGLCKQLANLGRLDEVAPDHFFLRTTVAEMAHMLPGLAAAAPNGEFSAAQLRDRLDNGRKVAIQILEFFDRHGVTARRGDLRRINAQRINLFGPAPEPSKQTTENVNSTAARRPDRAQTPSRSHPSSARTPSRH